MTPIKKLERVLGDNDPDLTDIVHMRNYCQTIPFDTFYEPVSIIDGLGKKRTLVNFTPEMVNAWVKHVCYSSKVRMINLEEATLSELSQARLIPAMVLIRSHFESAGLACLCQEELRKWIETNDSLSIQQLIPATFLGTSLFRAKKKDESLEGMLLLSEHDKVPSSRLVAALDNFFSTGDPTGRAHSLYGFLCEYTHPNMRALRDHIDIKDHETEGWFHDYLIDAKLEKAHYSMALNALRSSMKAGHSTCEMLHHTQFGYDGDEGCITLPTENDLSVIWDNLAKWPEFVTDEEKV